MNVGLNERWFNVGWLLEDSRRKKKDIYITIAARLESVVRLYVCAFARLYAHGGLGVWAEASPRLQGQSASQVGNE